MTEEEQKEAIEAMRKAQANMRAVLDRNSTLERELSRCVDLADRLIKNHVPSETYCIDHNQRYQPARQFYGEKLDQIRKTLP